ncbi:DUF3106 domain-containing protein [Massilia sp. S19_KUP03_FR1]|uniref:DUF3106 domain-containing protein n=1 Tax=Massilia sp. S19_KUP03_FR1 TaxID=3025503 RepID=UPI002FCD810D
MTTKRLRFGVAILGGALALAVCAAALHAQQTAPQIGQPAAPPPAQARKAPVKTADKPVWSQLSAAQKIALEPLQREWDPMEGVRKQKWLELANRYATMKPEEQQRVHERMREWVRLTPAQRAAARQNYTQAKTLAPNEKSATWESYKQLPDEQKQKLAEQAARKQLTNVPPAKSPQRSTTPVLRGAPTPATAAMATGSVSAAAPVK